MEPVTNCDQSKELVVNHDQLDDVVEITPEEEIDIAKLIVVVRGQQVLIDRDIAMLYKVETKVLNQKVKRNVARFPERFRFQLTKREMKELVTNCDRFESLKHSSSAPYAFTEQGISMLSAVVTSQKAVDTSIRIMDAFVGMRRFMAANAHIFQRLDRVERQQIESKLWMDLKKHNEQYREIKFLQLPHRNHDRFLIIDNDVYLLGASVKDMGVGMCAVTKMQVSPETVLQLL